jgi:hypothetical protein
LSEPKDAAHLQQHVYNNMSQSCHMC